jgi:hypothetical protein
MLEKLRSRTDNPGMVMELGKLEQVDPRTVWEHEAHGFTPWLLANPDRGGRRLQPCASEKGGSATRPEPS